MGPKPESDRLGAGRPEAGCSLDKNLLDPYDAGQRAQCACGCEAGQADCVNEPIAAGPASANSVSEIAASKADCKPEFPVRPTLPEPGQEERIPESGPALEEFLCGVLAEEKLWSDYIRQVSQLEDPGKGVFYASELHEARQYRMALRYKIDFCRARLARLNSL